MESRKSKNRDAIIIEDGLQLDGCSHDGFGE